MSNFNRYDGQSAQAVAYTDHTAWGRVSTHKVLRNTYMLLAMTLFFSGAMAAVSVSLQIKGLGTLITLIASMALLFITMKLRNSVWGLVSIFAFTGFMGMSLGPILSRYLAMPGGSSIVMTAMLMTGLIFSGLSAYVLVSKRDFSFMGGFLFAGLIVAVLASLGAFFFEMPALSLAVSAIMVLLMSGMILYETSNIIHGGETNYIMATIDLYLSIFNLFTSLLHLLGFIEKE